MVGVEKEETEKSSEKEASAKFSTDKKRKASALRAKGGAKGGAIERERDEGVQCYPQVFNYQELTTMELFGKLGIPQTNYLYITSFT